MTTVKIFLRKKPTKENKYPVVMRITKNRKQKLITLRLCDIKDWDFKYHKFKPNTHNYIKKNKILLKFNQKAHDIIDSFNTDGVDFNLNQFEDKFNNKVKGNTNNVIDFFNEIIEEKHRAGSISSAKAYKDCRNTLIRFKGENLSFKDITPAFLYKYEVYLRERGCTGGGIAFRMRELRAIINQAIKRQLIQKELYPFEDYKISKLKSVYNKTALTIDEIKKIKEVDLSAHPHLYEYHLYFLFSFYTRGMNFHDMMHLRWNNIRNGRIYYTRSKTKGKFNIEILQPVQEILNHFKAQKIHTHYVFPILLHNNLTPQQIADRKHKMLSRYNQRLKEIAALAGINKKLTSYVARHSFATIHKMNNTPIEKISEMMGHSNVITTMNYLNEFSNEELDKENRKLLGI